MICAVHAAIGAAVGRLAGRRSTGFAAGVATHLLGDLVPHKDFDPKTEAPLLAVTLAVIALRCGVKSPEFWGAVGGITPDFENAAYVTGLLPQEKLVFPTHVGGGKYHAPKVGSAWPQGVLAAACLIYALRRRR
ncbi:MAG TPA: hypothetical protein VM490_08550 [Armatimonadaceae bacterium]|nr:hypothetical protein [Armatimonadaceae bacterium]